MSFSDIVDYRIINPYQILDSFELIAKGEKPAEFQKISNDYNVKCWQLLEEGVYYFFYHIMMHETIKQGKESLFENEPDGIVLLDAYISEYAFIYECKQRKTSYNLSSDDIKRYKDYIKVKKHVISIKYNKMLSNFIFIAQEFNGDF